MKGILLCGGSGSRLRPMTNVINKHLLPVFSMPMCFFAIRTLKSFNIDDVMVITGKEHAGMFLDLLGNGRQFEMNFTYRLQDEAGGIAQALGLCRDFANNEDIVVILGDNIFDTTIKLGEFNGGAKIFLKSVTDPERFGVAEIEDGKIKEIIEKPKVPKSNLAVTGLYIYDKDIWSVIERLEPSARGEMEITDINNWYIKHRNMNYETLNGFWCDAGTPESLLRASNFIKKMKDNN